MNHLLLMAGGIGSRFGEDIPKQYTEIESRPIFWYIVERYLKMPEIDSITIVTNSQWRDLVEGVVEKYGNAAKIQITNGGETRSESVLNGLLKVKEIAKPEDVVLIHDATHPYVDENGTREVILATQKYGGATLASFEYDTCYLINNEKEIQNVVPRQNLAVGASPEAFLFEKIYEIYTSSSKEELANMTSAGAIAIANGIVMKVVETNVLNLKITYKRDMELFKNLFRTYFFNDR